MRLRLFQDWEAKDASGVPFGERWPSCVIGVLVFLSAQSSFHPIFLTNPCPRITVLTFHQHNMRYTLALALGESGPLG